MQENTTRPFKRKIDALEKELGVLQRHCRQLGIPVLIAFEGYRASGRGGMINRLIQPLDPRGYKVSCVATATVDEQMRPFLWRFWLHVPSTERMAIFDRSWYWKLLDESASGKPNQKQLIRAYEDVTAFEQQLNDSGIAIFKFFLDISAAEQAARCEKRRRNPITAWRADEGSAPPYDDYKKAAERMIEATDLSDSPWKVVNADHLPSANAVVLDHLVTVLQKRVDDVAANNGLTRTPPLRDKLPAFSDAPNLQHIDLSMRLAGDAYRKLLLKRQQRIFELHHEIHRLRIPVVIVYEGWDASGKGGNIRRLTREMDPRGYEVIPVSAPSETEKAHHYLWRFWNQFPKAGHLTIFDRSWYGRVLVERIEGFCSETDWQRAYNEINIMEESFCQFGAVVVKFWMHIDQKEQLRRFTARKKDPFKRWKMTDEDFRNREKWTAYEQAINDMFLRTHTPHAPWSAIEGNCKRFARIKALDIVIDAIEKRIEQEQ